MAEKRGPTSQALSPELIYFLLEYSFPYDLSTENDGHSQAKKLRSVIKIISNTIQDYAAKHYDDDREVQELINAKIKSKKDRESYLQGDHPLQLLDNKTLKKCLPSSSEDLPTASLATIQIIELFKRITDEEKKRKKEFAKNIERVAGYYCEINTHHSTSQLRFQQSLLYIGTDGSSMTTYKNSSHQIKPRKLRTELVNTNGLLLTIEEGDYALVFYLYIGNGDIRPDYIQGVYIYSNDREQGNAVANLVVFKRMKVSLEASEKEVRKLFHPKRELNNLSGIDPFDKGKDSGIVESEPDLTIRENIQYFLAHQGRPLSTKMYDNRKPFNFSRARAVAPGPFGQDALFYDNTKRLLGTYLIYFNERFSSYADSLPFHDESNYFSTIGRGILTLKKDTITGALKGEMQVNKDKKGNILTFSGYLMNHQLNDSSTLILSLYLEKENHILLKQPDRYINLLLNIVNDDRLVGSHNVMYSAPTKLGSGIVIAIRRSLIDEKITKPTSLFSPFHQGANPREHKIINYLFAKRKALGKPPEYRDLSQFKSTLYKGVYQLCSIAEGKDLSTELLVIFQNGYVIHNNDSGQKFFGDIEQLTDSINIQLRNKNASRIEFICLKIDNRDPSFVTQYSGILTRTAKNGEPEALKIRVQPLSIEIPTNEDEMKELLVVYTSKGMKKNMIVS